MTPATDTTAPDTADMAEAPILIRHTHDGRRVEVIGRYLCLDGRREADALVAVRSHPNRRAIWQTAPDATHMAGRIPLTAHESARVQAAFDAARAAHEATPFAVAERIRHAADQILRLRIDE